MRIIAYNSFIITELVVDTHKFILASCAASFAFSYRRMAGPSLSAPVRQLSDNTHPSISNLKNHIQQLALLDR